MTLEQLNKQIKKCKKCHLWKTAKNVVIGEGPINAKIMIVGQNPGTEEDKTGKPFTGRAGKYLDKSLVENGLDRKKIFVTNIVKHVTPKNRKPNHEEIEACITHLKNQIELIKPKIIILLGAVAWQAPRINGITYFETIHPSAAMRFTKMKKRFQTDFANITQIIEEIK